MIPCEARSAPEALADEIWVEHESGAEALGSVALRDHLGARAAHLGASERDTDPHVLNTYDLSLVGRMRWAGEGKRVSRRVHSG